MKNPDTPFLRTGLCLAAALALTTPLVLTSADREIFDEAVAPVAEARESAPSTNTSAEFRLSEEALQEIRREIEVSAARNAQAITAALTVIEPTLARMHQRDLEAMERSNRTVLTAAGIFAAAGFVGLLVLALMLVRAMSRMSEAVAMANSRGPNLGPGTALAMLGPGHSSGMGGAAEQASSRFLGAVEQLETRIRELEGSLQHGPESSATTAGPRAEWTTARSHEQRPPANIRSLPSAGTSVAARSASVPDIAPELAVLLGKGQALLNLDEIEKALACFDQALALEPNNAEALVKRGLALEKLQNWELAAETYSQAIALDDTLTVAYLYKGGVCNRLQRYREALECYEEALKAEKRRRAS